MSNSNPGDVTKPLQPIYFLKMEVKVLEFLAYTRIFQKYAFLIYIYKLYVYYQVL